MVGEEGSIVNVAVEVVEDGDSVIEAPGELGEVVVCAALGRLMIPGRIGPQSSLA